MSPEETSEDLVARYVAGDADAMGALYDRHEKDVRSIVCFCMAGRKKWIRSEPRLDEVCSDVWLAVTTTVDGFEGKSKFTTWLFRVTCWRTAAYVKNLLKAREKQAPESDGSDEGILESIPARGAAIPDGLDTAEILPDVERALAGLSEEERVAFVLREMEGVEWDDIASITDAPKTTAWKRVARATTTLQSLLPRWDTRKSARSAR